MAGFDGHFYYPSRQTYESPGDYGLAHDEVTFPSRDGVLLHGWYIPATGACRGRVLHFHGNAGNIGAHVGLIHWLPRSGFDVFMFDYRGYGRSSGEVTRAGTIADGHAALDCLLSREDGGGRPVFAYGQSLGGAVALVTAADRPEIAAVVAESPFSAYRRIVALHVARLIRLPGLARLAARVMVARGFDPIDVIHRIAPRPVLLIAAQHDKICFPEMARELLEAAGEPKELWLVPGVGHLEVAATAGAELSERVIRFFQRAGALEGTDPPSRRAGKPCITP